MEDKIILTTNPKNESNYFYQKYKEAIGNKLAANIDKELMGFTVNFNSLELKQFNRFENGRMVTYGYSIERDKNGFEVSRTTPEPISSIGWENGEPFTKLDLLEIQNN